MGGMGVDFPGDSAFNLLTLSIGLYTFQTKPLDFPYHHENLRVPPHAGNRALLGDDGMVVNNPFISGKWMGKWWEMRVWKRKNKMEHGVIKFPAYQW